MKCPDLGGRACIGKDCRDWDEKSQQCQVLTQRQITTKGFEELFSGFTIIAREQQYSGVWTRLAIQAILSDPKISLQQKGAIQQALKAPSPEVAEKLLKDQGLIE